MTDTSTIYVPGKVRTTQSPLYDSLHVATTTQLAPSGIIKMFNNVQGIGGIGPNVTNMQKAQELSGGEMFTVRSLRVVNIGSNTADWISFCQNFTVRLILGSGAFAYADAPAEYWAGGAGISGPTSTPNNGVPDPRAIVPFDVDPITLTDGVNFRVELIGTSFATTADFFLRVYLDGQRSQPAQ